MPTALPPTPTPTATAVAPTAAPTPEPPTPVPTTSPTPSRVPIPGPPGYLSGYEHGLSLRETTQVASATRQGWVDITLALAVTKFAVDPEAAGIIDVDASEESLCFATTVGSPDCLTVEWGSCGLFHAVLRPTQVTGAVP